MEQMGSGWEDHPDLLIVDGNPPARHHCPARASVPLVPAVARLTSSG